DPDPRLTELFESPLTCQERRVGGPSHCRFGTRKAIRQRLTGEFCQIGLGVEQVEMAWSAVDETPNDRFGLRREMRGFRRKWIDDGGRVSAGVLSEHRPKS